MTFFQFASNNVRRNGRAYAAYFMSSAFSILFFFLYAVLANHPDLRKGYVDLQVIAGMQVAEYMILVFSFFSILYSMGSFLRGRNKEFGILTVLGITNRQLIWMIFLENMVLGIAAITSGLLIGLLGSKLFLLLGSAILDIPPLPFYIPAQALLTTSVAFIVLFLLVSVVTTFFLRTSTVLSLLKGSQKPKKEPQASWLLALLAVVLLLAAYGGAMVYRAGLNDTLPVIPLIIVIMVAIGTYLLYAQLSIFLLRLLKARRSYYWRGTRMLWLSELTYSMKDNARLFFVVAMILSVAFTATGAIAVVEAQINTFADPLAFTLTFQDSHSKMVHFAESTLTQTLESNHLTYSSLQESFMTLKDKQGYPTTMLMSVTNYNHLAAFVQVQPLTVQTGEAVDPNPQDKHVAPLALDGGQKHLHVIVSPSPMALNALSLSGMNLFVITDQEYAQQSRHVSQGLYVGYAMADWKKTTNLSSSLMDRLYTVQAGVAYSSSDSFEATSRALDYLTTYQLPNITLFIGLFTALIFLIASGSFLYFRLYTVLTERKEQYRAIAKIGLTSSEMSKSVTIQVATLFFAPFLIAILNVVCAMIAMKNNMHVGAHVLWPTVDTIGLFLAIQLLYFLIIRMQYLTQMKQALI